MVGTGYVGLVSGACFAEFGADVTCIDVDEDKIAKLVGGSIPIYEPGLGVLVERNASAGRLKFTTEFAEAIGAADLVFIAVGTPSRRGEGFADLTYVYDAARKIARYLEGYTLIVGKSTVPIGTARNVAGIVRESSNSMEFDIASNPEFLREGSAISDFMRPDRVVIGAETARAENLLRELYRPLNLRETPILVTSLESAELIKYASNAFLATKISFINEMAGLCDATGADVHDVAKGMGMDGRIGPKFLHPGPGYGGSCFPKDTAALVRIAQEYGVSSRIVESVIEVNSAQKIAMITKIRKALGGEEAGKTISVLGLTFKPETDDMRDSPAVSILPALLERGARICAHDPAGMAEAKKVLPGGVEYFDDPYTALVDADALVILTEWNAYRGFELARIKDIMRGNIFIDLRNIYERELVESEGFSYHCVGR
tara:strand:+ start:149 stop:1441 length:1293 start_codon:yes stop_codon:yes gene_type:complete